MIVKIFLSKSFKTSISSAIKHTNDPVMYDIITSSKYIYPYPYNGEEIQQEFYEDITRKECIKTLETDFLLTSLCERLKRYNLKNLCYNIVIYFNQQDQVINNSTREKIIKAWFKGMGLNPDEINYVAFNGHETTPTSIHIILSRTIDEKPIINLNVPKNRYVCKEIEETFNLVKTKF